MKIAGGMFGFEENLDNQYKGGSVFMKESSLFFLNARCAIQFLIGKLKPPQVWLPSYLCCSMMESIDKRITELNFFPVEYNLEILSTTWLEQLRPGSLVILIDYFGFPCDRHIIREVQAKGAFVLEDASQALLSTHVGLESDFVVFSPRKTVGVPDGGILRYPRDKHNFLFTELQHPPHEWWLKALESCIIRREFDKYGEDRSWYELFQQVEITNPIGLYRMSELSKLLLESAFDYQFIADTRRSNYAYFAEYFPKHALIKELDEGTVPIGFPILTKNRDQVRQTLFKHQIYPPIHWNIDECVPKSFIASHELSKKIMTIPCDQRLSMNDVSHIKTILQESGGLN